MYQDGDGSVSQEHEMGFGHLKSKMLNTTSGYDVYQAIDMQIWPDLGRDTDGGKK